MVADLGSHLDFPCFLHCQSSLGCLWQGGLLQNCGLQPRHIFCLTDLPCSPAPWLSAPSGRLEYCGLSAGSKVGTVACHTAGADGPGFGEPSPIPNIFPHSDYSGNSAANRVEDSCDEDRLYNGYGLLHISALPWKPTRTCDTCSLRNPFSCDSIKLCSLSVSYAVKVLPGVILYGSLVSFLLMNQPYPFFTLNHFTVSKTFTAMTFWSSTVGTPDLRPRGCCTLRAAGGAGLGVGSAECKLAGGCCVSASPLMVVVMATAAPPEVGV